MGAARHADATEEQYGPLWSATAKQHRSALPHAESVELDAPAQAYIKKAGAFVLKLSFKGLVTAIYNSYPDTKAASIFRG